MIGDGERHAADDALSCSPSEPCRGRPAPETATKPSRPRRFAKAADTIHPTLSAEAVVRRPKRSFAGRGYWEQQGRTTPAGCEVMFPACDRRSSGSRGTVVSGSHGYGARWEGPARPIEEPRELTSEEELQALVLSLLGG